MMQRNRENFCLEVANILNILISVGIIVLEELAGNVYGHLINLIIVGLQMVYLVIWCYALYSLFARFQSSENLLPRKRGFIVHAILLIVYYVSIIIQRVTRSIETADNCGLSSSCFDICASINNIFVTIGSACAVTTFAYVVYSQISFTGKQKGRREALRNVILCGKTSVEDVEKAVLKQNAHLPEDKLDDIRKQFKEFKSF
jgi:hypothetical protein